MDSELQAGWRLQAGAALFGISILLPVAGVPLAATLGLSTPMAASQSGALLVGAEILGVAAVAVMGSRGLLIWAEWSRK